MPGSTSPEVLAWAERLAGEAPPLPPEVAQEIADLLRAVPLDRDETAGEGGGSS